MLIDHLLDCLFIDSDISNVLQWDSHLLAPHDRQQREPATEHTIAKRQWHTDHNSVFLRHGDSVGDLATDKPVALDLIAPYEAQGICEDKACDHDRDMAGTAAS